MFQYKKIIFLVVIIFSVMSLQAQPSGRAAKESKLDPFLNVLEYPLIKGSKWVGVVPVKNVTDKPEASKVYKLLFDFTQNGTSANMENKPNEGIEEICRMMNLHIAAGIKKENLKATVVVHSAASMAILNNDAYFKKFKVNNPNADLINQLQNAEVKFVLCGQTMKLRGIQDSELYKNVLISEAAKVTLSKYQTIGYVIFNVSDGN